MTRSVFIKVTGIALALSLSLVSCATSAWVGTKMDPALKGLQPGASVGIVPFIIDYKVSTGLEKVGKEAPSQDRSPSWLPYNIKTVVASPDAIRDYALSQSDLSLMVRDTVATFITSSDPFDITVSKDFKVKRFANTDQETKKNIVWTGMVKSLQAIGAYDAVTIASLAKENGVQFVLGGTIQIQGETAYITPRQKAGSNDSYAGSPSPWKPGDAFAELYITYHIDLYSAETGLKVDSSDNYKIEYKSISNSPYVKIPGVTISEYLGIPDVSALSAYMNSTAFKTTIQKGLLAALDDYTPLLRSYFEMVYQEVKPATK